MVKIISDSTCDLSEELVKRYDITILPLHILLGDEEYLDGVNITPQEIFDWSDEHKTTPKTSAPSAEQAVELLKPYVEKWSGGYLFCHCIRDVIFHECDASCSGRTECGKSGDGNRFCKSFYRYPDFLS